MIKTIIFDFGNVFIDLDIEYYTKNMLESLEINEFSEEINAFNNFYEQGLISTNEFLNFYTENFPKLTKEHFTTIWNSILKDFPKHRLEFIKELRHASKYKLILLSNTNEIHIDWIKQHVPFYEDFKNCFDVFYLSHEIELRKPNQDIFKFVLSQNNLKASECFFIDDNAENIKTANTLNIKTWHISPKTEDVSTLFKVKSHLF